MQKSNRFQQAMFVRLGDRKWDAIPEGDITILYRKVGFAFFGKPQLAPDENHNNTGYDQNQLDVIDKICQIMTKRADRVHGQICMVCIFILRFRGRLPIPILKVLCPNGLELFISSYDWDSDTIGQECTFYEGFWEFRDECLRAVGVTLFPPKTVPIGALMAESVCR